MSVADALGLENLTLGEVICLISFVVGMMIIVAVFTPSSLGYAFFTFGGITYIIAVLLSTRHEGEYNQP
jgi:Ca2+/H+ antiporter